MKVLTSPSSGSIAGTTFSHNRAGQYTRNRRTPVVGTRTPRQGVVKGNLAEASRAWQNLSAADQNAWTSFANAHPVVDALGQSIKLTGHQYYVRCSASLLNVGQIANTSTPTSVAVTAESIQGWAVEAGGPAFCVRVASSASDFYYASLSKYTSLGANYQKTFHQVESNTGDVTFLDLTADLTAWAGTSSVGNKAWIRLTPVNQYGITGQDLIQQTPVIAAMPITAAVLTSPLAAHVTVTYASGPSTADVILLSSPTLGGTYTFLSYNAAPGSPASITATAGQYVKAVLFDLPTQEFSHYSNSILVT